MSDIHSTKTSYPTHTIDELIERRLKGWRGDEFVYLSMLGELSILGEQPTIEKTDHYHGLQGCSVIIVSTRQTANDGYLEAEKLITAGVAHLCFWVLELPYICELVWNGYRHPTPSRLFLEDYWANKVRGIAQELAA